MLPFATVVGLTVAAAGFVAYVLWPTWPNASTAAEAPSLPITIAGVLFEVPPATIRFALQRHPGPQERMDLAFLWPSLQPPRPDAAERDQALRTLEAASDGAAAGKPAARPETGRPRGLLFVTITALGSLLPPAERLHQVYPHYAEATAKAAANGLAILPFRADTPYAGQDLVYFADNPDRFFALCTRAAGPVPGTCISDQAIGTAEIALRFPRSWLDDWRTLADGFDRLTAQLHPPPQ